MTPDGGREINDRTESGIVLHTMMGDQDGIFLNRVGNVVTAPLHNPISARKGDKVLVHHNTFRKGIDQEGNMYLGNMVGNGSYFQLPNRIYGYKNKDQWYSTNNWVLIDPINHEYSELKGVETLRPDKGSIAFPMDPLFNTLDAEVGDFITFRTGKFVTTVLDGKTYYRIMAKHILLNHGKINNKTE